MTLSAAVFGVGESMVSLLPEVLFLFSLEHLRTDYVVASESHLGSIRNSCRCTRDFHSCCISRCKFRPKQAPILFSRLAVTAISRYLFHSHPPRFFVLKGSETKTPIPFIRVDISISPTYAMRRHLDFRSSVVNVCSRK